MRKILILGIMILASVTACSTTAKWKTADNDHINFPPTSARDVLVYSTSQADQPYLIIGPVVAAADAGENATTAVDVLKKSAAKLGADAIVELEINPTFGYWTSAIQAKGIAVKFVKGESE